MLLPDEGPPEITKSCRCGRDYEHWEWNALPLSGRGHSIVAGDEHDPPMLMEWRDCSCGSTITVDLYELGAVQRPPWEKSE